MQLRGPQHEVAKQLPKVARDARTLLSEVGMEISTGAVFKPGGKSGVGTGSPWLRHRLKLSFSRMGIAVTKAQVYLGVDVIPGMKQRPKQRFSTFYYLIQKGQEK